MSSTLSQLLFEASLLGRKILVVQVARPVGEPEPGAQATNDLAKFIEGHVLRGDDVATPPLVRESAQVIEVTLLVPLCAIDQQIDFFSALERRGVEFRAAEIDGDGFFDCVYPPVAPSKWPAFAALFEADDAEAQAAATDAEIRRQHELFERTKSAIARGALGGATALARLDTLRERQEALEAARKRLGAIQFAMNAGWVREQQS